jgi:acetyl esterase/lipase
MVASVPLGTIFFALCTLVAVAPIRRPRWLARLSWIGGSGPDELPLLFLAVVIVSSAPAVVAGDLAPAGGWSGCVVALLTGAGLLVVLRRALRAGPALDAALGAALGPRWRAAIDPALTSRLRRHLPWTRILVTPWPVRPRAVERVANIAYGDRGKDDRLDVFRHRVHPTGAPTLVHLHGGRFRWGRKNLEARALVHHLASQGWTCITADYHLSATPAEGFPEHLIDVKRVLAWTRTHADEHGVDPDAIFLAGSPAGAHLTAMAALTANDPRFQPGFEQADTSIRAGIGLYGYYGALGGDDRPPSDPLAYAASNAPPCFVIHGDHDTYTPVAGARRLVEHLRATSTHPVAFAELPGAQHSFDVLHSVRFEHVVDAIEAFAAWVRSRRADDRADVTGARVG